MAAGRGSRMKPLTDHIPKAMAPYKGSTLIANGIKKLRPFIENIHITVGYKGAVLAEHTIGLSVNSVFNTNGKGNAYWIYNTLVSKLDEPVLVLTADNITEIDLEFVSNQYEKLGNPLCMVVPVKPIPGLDGDYIHHKDHVIHELSRKKPSEIYCSGIQVLNPLRLNQETSKTEDFNEVWEQVRSQNQLYCSEEYPKNWFTVDTIEQLDFINNQI